MSEETQVATETVSEGSTQASTNESTDNSGLIAESKKYRKRSQDAEARLAELEAKMAKEEELKMIAEGKKDELIERYQNDNKTLLNKANRWDSYEENRRQSLLEQHPEDDRATLVDLPLDTLEYVTNKINSSKANAPEVVGNPRGTTPSKPFSEMNETEKRAWHKNVLNNVNN